MIEVRQEDREAAGALARFLCESEAQVSRFIAGELDHTDIAQAFAAHRQQAEDAMRERCAVLCGKHAGILALAQGHEDAEGQEDRWYDGGKYAAKLLATAIRGIDAGGEGQAEPSG